CVSARVRHHLRVGPRVVLQSRSSHEDRRFSRVIRQAFSKRENLKQSLAPPDLENSRFPDRSQDGHGMALHLTHKHTHVRIFHVGAPEKFLKNKFELARCQPRGVHGLQERQRDFAGRRNANFAIQLLSFKHTDVENVVKTNTIVLRAWRGHWSISLDQFLEALIPLLARLEARRRLAGIVGRLLAGSRRVASIPCKANLQGSAKASRWEP